MPRSSDRATDPAPGAEAGEAWKKVGGDASIRVDEMVVKVKVGEKGSVVADADRITAIVRSFAKESTGQDLRLRLDANQGWTFEEAAEF